jgi:hypothetical protein
VLNSRFVRCSVVTGMAVTLAAAAGCGRLGYEGSRRDVRQDASLNGTGGSVSDARPTDASAGGAGGTREAGTTGASGGEAGVGGAIGGLCTPAVPSICKPAVPIWERDTDDDGTPDVWDDDDDNDGIPDTVECFSDPVAPLLNGGFEQPIVSAGGTPTLLSGSQVPGWEDTASDDLIAFWRSDAGAVPSVAGSQFIQLNRTEAEAIYQDIATVPNTTLRWGFYQRGKSGSETVEIFVGPPDLPSSQGRYTTGTTDWVQYAGQYVVPLGQKTTRIRIESVVPLTSAGNFLDQIALSPACTRDTDRDGCVDSEDLDSNGDCVLD